MRLSEALKLDRDDVDLDEGILNIRRTKFRKSRLVLLHGSTSVVLKAYAEKRNLLFPAPATLAFFISEQGTRITGCTTRYTFAKVSRQVGLRPPIVGGKRHGCGPRLHDLRHRFAARTLIDCYRTGLDAERQLPKLAAYLGHVHVADTYWYLEAVPELLQLATERVVQHQQKEQLS
jgi:integrase